jgi:DNA mismatch repair protein MutS
VEDPKSSRKLVHREVTRVLTPGTVVEEMLLEPKDHNFLASVFSSEEGVGLAFVDLSTSDFLATQLSGVDAWPLAADELCRFGPREVLFPDGGGSSTRDRLLREWGPDWVQSPVDAWVFKPDYARRLLIEHFTVATLEGFGCEGRPLAVAAAGSLIHYLRETQLGQLAKIAGLRFYEPSNFMKLDASTLTNLELVQTIDGNRRGSLLDLLDRTCTGMGGRLLKTRLLAPLLDPVELNHRLDAVEDFVRSVQGLDRIRRKLAEVHDLERLVSRVLAGVVTPREMVSLHGSLLLVPDLRSLLAPMTALRLGDIRDALDDLPDVRRLVEQAIADEPPASMADPGVIRDGYSTELDELRAIRSSGRGYIASLEARERQRTGIQSLKVKFNQVFGYFIEVTKANLPQVPQDYVRKQTLVNCERFVTPELQDYEEKVLGAEERIALLEKELYSGVRQAVAAEAARIQSTARLIAELDVFAALAEVSARSDYVRPTLSENDEIYVRQARHPVVEVESRPFIPNDLYMNGSTDQLLILTGPNMGGKSTYLRQTALLVILTQMGSFVPAREARIGLVDRIYTRVGASDNLARGRSTFMVEMIETANILNTATERSLVLLDEVGRGTATFDGLSIAWAVAEFLSQVGAARPKTLFATHYHELTKLADVRPGVRNYCMAVQEAGKEIVFLRRVTPGVADRSYGIEVARLAGLPREVLRRASEILERLERKEIDLTGKARVRSTEEVVQELQKSLF